ncbi:MAG: MutS2/Smr-associated SH3 domain-containing protein, partial [Angelakisella sp.]
KTQLEDEKKRLKKQMEAELQKAREEAQTIVERVRSQTDALLDELEALKKEKDKADFSAKVAQVKGGYKGRVEKLRVLADPVVKLPEDGYRLPRKLKSGDTVTLSDLGTDGVILSGPDSSGNYLVQAGIMKTSVAAENLRLVENVVKKPSFSNRRTVKSTGGKTASAPELEL